MQTPDPSLNLGKLMDLFNAQTGTVNILLNFYIVVSLGVLGFVLKEKDLRGNWKVKLLFSVGFVLFAFGNFEAITRSQGILVAISKTLQKAAPEQKDYRLVLEAFKAQRIFVMGIGYSFISLLVVVAIWLPDIVARIHRRRKAAKIA